ALDVMLEGIAEHLVWLDRAIAAIEDEIEGLIAASTTLTSDNDRLRSAPGIGPVAATTLMALLPELGNRYGQNIAALAGLAARHRPGGGDHAHGPAARTGQPLRQDHRRPGRPGSLQSRQRHLERPAPHRSGRRRVRQALYMAALNAARTHPRFKAAYQRLLQAG